MTEDEIVAAVIEHLRSEQQELDEHLGYFHSPFEKIGDDGEPIPMPDVVTLDGQINVREIVRLVTRSLGQ